MTVKIVKYATPAQDSLKRELQISEMQLILNFESRDPGFEIAAAHKEIKKLRKLARPKKLLSSKIKKADHQKTFRNRT